MFRVHFLFDSSLSICLHSKCFVTITKYLKEAKMIRKWVYLVWRFSGMIELTRVCWMFSCLCHIMIDSSHGVMGLSPPWPWTGSRDFGSIVSLEYKSPMDLKGHYLWRIHHDITVTSRTKPLTYRHLRILKSQTVVLPSTHYIRWSIYLFQYPALHKVFSTHCKGIVHWNKT